MDLVTSLVAWSSCPAQACSSPFTEAATMGSSLFSLSPSTPHSQAQSVMATKDPDVGKGLPKDEEEEDGSPRGGVGAHKGPMGDSTEPFTQAGLHHDHTPSPSLGILGGAPP